jgi:hypothetical protein
MTWYIVEYKDKFNFTFTVQYLEQTIAVMAVVYNVYGYNVGTFQLPQYSAHGQGTSRFAVPLGTWMLYRVSSSSHCVSSHWPRELTLCAVFLGSIVLTACVMRKLCSEGEG